jgi:hypothetical protein
LQQVQLHQYLHNPQTQTQNPVAPVTVLAELAVTAETPEETLVWLMAVQAVQAVQAAKVAKEPVATAAYLDNFEHIEASIGEELSGQGEELLRERLRDQINSNVSLDSIRQTVNEINMVLDKAQASLTP